MSASEREIEIGEADGRATGLRHTKATDTERNVRIQGVIQIQISMSIFVNSSVVHLTPVIWSFRGAGLAAVIYLAN